jgi:hypothetical protein
MPLISKNKGTVIKFKLNLEEIIIWIDSTEKADIKRISDCVKKTPDCSTSHIIGFLNRHDIGYKYVRDGNELMGSIAIEIIAEES